MKKYIVMLIGSLALSSCEDYLTQENPNKIESEYYFTDESSLEIYTNGFIRWPFVYEGFMLGLLGAVIAFFLQWALYAAVARGVDSNDTLQ